METNVPQAPESLQIIITLLLIVIVSVNIAIIVRSIIIIVIVVIIIINIITIVVVVILLLLLLLLIIIIIIIIIITIIVIITVTDIVIVGIIIIVVVLIILTILITISTIVTITIIISMYLSGVVFALDLFVGLGVPCPRESWQLLWRLAGGGRRGLRRPNCLWGLPGRRGRGDTGDRRAVRQSIQMPRHTISLRPTVQQETHLLQQRRIEVRICQRKQRESWRSEGGGWGQGGGGGERGRRRRKKDQEGEERGRGGGAGEEGEGKQEETEEDEEEGNRGRCSLRCCRRCCRSRFGRHCYIAPAAPSGSPSGSPAPAPWAAACVVLVLGGRGPEHHPGRGSRVRHQLPPRELVVPARHVVLPRHLTEGCGEERSRDGRGIAREGERGEIRGGALGACFSPPPCPCWMRRGAAGAGESQGSSSTRRSQVSSETPQAGPWLLLLLWLGTRCSAELIKQAAPRQGGRAWPGRPGGTRTGTP